jgi:hypothetical protein
VSLTGQLSFVARSTRFLPIVFVRHGHKLAHNSPAQRRALHPSSWCALRRHCAAPSVVLRPLMGPSVSPSTRRLTFRLDLFWGSR